MSRGSEEWRFGLILREKISRSLTNKCSICMLKSLQIVTKLSMSIAKNAITNKNDPSVTFISAIYEV